MNPVKIRNVQIGVGIPKICVPIVGVTEEEILTAAKEILTVPADIVEWRVDWYESALEIEQVLVVAEKVRRVLGDLPLLFTFRTKAEGGEKEITFEDYKELLLQVAKSNTVDMIDVEVFMNHNIADLIVALKNEQVKVVGSNHDFEKTPEKQELIRRLCHMQVVGADIPKIAVMPQNSADVLTLLAATEEMNTKYADRPIVTMSMAGLGAVSRISGEIFGSAITFGTVKKASAPGQIEVHKLKEILEILH